MSEFSQLINDVQSCTLCRPHLPHGVRPIIQINPNAKILIAGQAPGKKVHQSGIPFDDASGERLRAWMGLSNEKFYNAEDISILPMGFCYPGKGKSGDLAPRPECAQAWREKLLLQLPHRQLTLAIGQYAQTYHLPSSKKTLTHNVKSWKETWPALVPLPHPSPRNNIWLKKNPWFEDELIPELQKKIAHILGHE